VQSSIKIAFNLTLNYMHSIVSDSNVSYVACLRFFVNAAVYELNGLTAIELLHVNGH